jgi:hypothetical protein
MSLPSIYCVVTADYEIFLGRNFLSHDEVLFRPAWRMMEVCEARSVPVTFFADVCSVWAHRAHDELAGYVESFESQLKSAVARGHDVQLHLHPHWLNSTYLDNQWRVSTEKMYLYELGYHQGENAALSIINAGVKYLEDLLHPTKSDYRCHAFRAAGLALQPEEDKLIAALLAAGINVDSSIAKDIRLKMDTVNIDYTGMPGTANWYVDPDGGLRQPRDSGLLEVPIATFQSGLLARIGFLISRALSVSMRRGASISRSEKQTRLANLLSLLRYNLRYIGTNPWFLLSCDTKGVNLNMLLRGVDDYIDGHSESDIICLSMINHPKMMFRQQFDLLENLINSMRQKYQDRISFVTFGDVLSLVKRKAG